MEGNFENGAAARKENSWRQNAGILGRMTPSSSVKSTKRSKKRRSNSRKLKSSSSASNIHSKRNRSAGRSNVSKPNYDYLKKLHGSTKDKKEQLRRQYEQIFRTQEQRELEKCTFKPKINESKPYKTSLDFYQR